MLRLAASDLRDKIPTADELASIKRNPIYIICDNILDTYNVGAIFRLADAASVAGIYLVGETAIPTDPRVGHKIHKASVGVWQWIPWKHTETITEAIEDVKKLSNSKNLQPTTYNVQLNVIAIEQHPKSIPYTKADYSFPLVLILGHETTGVSDEGLKLADQVVEIPMFGVNKSMNVMVSLAIVLWEVIKKGGE